MKVDFDWPMIHFGEPDRSITIIWYKPSNWLYLLSGLAWKLPIPEKHRQAMSDWIDGIRWKLEDRNQ